MDLDARTRVIIAEPFAASGEAVLRERGIDVQTCVGVPRDELLRRLRGADGLIVRSETRVDRDFLASSRRLRVVGRAGVGVDAIDVPAATEAGIVVVNTPAANTLAATELTFALMLATMRNVVAASRSIGEGRWERAPFVGTELAGKTLGVVGLGRIGGAVATRGLAFEMRILAYDPFVPQSRAETLHVELTDLDDLLARCDVLTLHVPLGAQTRGMIGAEQLRRMKPSAIVVNCARGGVVDESALLDALDAKRIRAAAIDVVAHEPPPENSPGSRLHRHPCVLATPHLGGSTHEALERIAVELARDVADVLQGRPAAGAVNAPAPSGADAERVRAYVDLADRFGRLLPQLYADAMRGPLRLTLHGELAASDSAPVRAAFLSGLLQTTTARRVSIVNAEAIAREVGIDLETAADPVSSPYASKLSVRAAGHAVAGTVLHGGPRVVELDAFEVDAIPQGALVFTRHRDVPGMVGRAGTILGDAGVNISTMQVARGADGEDAMMVLGIDRPISAAALGALRAIPEMISVESVVV